MLASAALLFAGQGVRVWTAPSYERVLLQQVAGTNTAASLSVCRNETESVQVVASGSADQLAELTFQFNAGVNADGNTLPIPVLYWEYDIPVKKSSPRAALGAGLYPDALVPFPNGSQPNINAFRAIEGTVNFRIWADYAVPAAQRPGLYQAKCVVKKGGVTVSTVNITVHVFNEILPKRPALKSYFGLNEHRVAELNHLDREDDGIALSKVMDGYYKLMMDCRIEPGLVFATSAPVDENGKLRWDEPAGPELPSAREIIHRYFSQGTFQQLHLPMWRDYPFADPLGKDRAKAIDYLVKLARLCQQTAPDAELFFSVGSLDEPDSAEAYQKIRDWAVLVHAASDMAKVKISFFNTEQPQPQRAEWGSLEKSVDIWSPHVMWVWEDLESKPGKHEIAKRIAAGDQVWCYPALSQFRDTWISEKGQPDTRRDSYPPVWLSDYPAVQFRILPWLCAAHNLTGIHYWDVFQWPAGTDPWKDAGTFLIDDETFNGDGLLIYPPAPAALRGDLPLAPCPSIRLKWVRDGFDDYDHLTILRKTHPERAARILARIARGFADWESSPQEIFQARRAISEAMPKSP